MMTVPAAFFLSLNEDKSAAAMMLDKEGYCCKNFKWFVVLRGRKWLSNGPILNEEVGVLRFITKRKTKESSQSFRVT